MFERSLRKLIHFWLQNVHPKLTYLIATIGSVGLVLCLLNLFLLAKLSEEVWEKEVFTFDKSLLLWIHQFANPTIDNLMLMITKLNNPEVAVTVSGISLAICGPPFCAGESPCRDVACNVSTGALTIN